ncbi:hypothetical protein Lsed01_00178 [Demequina sediminis]|uniref:Uncharacterized protein n=2 Tax=Demequina sediminis TaxID=1930058 RepID=A0ABP9WFI9_9MICO|nr:hypothetical protein [Demequina sediminis]BDZ60860.1 hypothetical protein GCM10025873_06510 [Demequina sediminis]
MARVRRAAFDPTGLPPEVAAGPTHPAWGGTGDPDDHGARSRWQDAGREWSRAALGNLNGWMTLLPRDVRLEQSARGRARRMGALED